MSIGIYDLQPGDLAVLNNLVYVTDWCGIFLGVAAGVVLSSPMKLQYKILCSGLLMVAAYQVINVWA